MITIKETSGDTLHGNVDGINANFVVSFDYIDVTCYINTSLVDPADYTLIPPRTINFNTAPSIGDLIEVEYTSAITVGCVSCGGAEGGIPTISDADNLAPQVGESLENIPDSLSAQDLFPRLTSKINIPEVLSYNLRPVILGSTIESEDEVEPDEEECIVAIVNVICQASDQVGDLVYIKDVKSGNLLQVEKADPNDPDKIPAFGMLVSKSGSTTGIVRWIGKQSVDETLEVDLGKRVIWLGTDGRIAQSPPGGGAYEQPIGTVTDTHEIYIEPDWKELPIPAYVSHYNTSDGVGDCTVSDITTSTRHISNPNGQFLIGSWTAGEQQPATRTSPISYSSVNPCSIIDNTSTTFLVTITGADGLTAIAGHSLILTGNQVSSANGITITVTNWGTDTNKFRANIDVDIDLDTILPTGGRFEVELKHINGADGTFTKTQGPMFYDKETNVASLSGVGISETVGQVITRRIDGVWYYDLGSQFTVGISDIDNLNDESYPTTQVELNGSEYGLPTLDLEGGDLTDWDTDWNNQNASYDKTNWAITQTNYFAKLNGVANVRARTKDWTDGTWINSPAANIIVDTHHINDTDLAKYFYDAAYRCALTADFDTASAEGWDFNSFSGINDALLINGGCEHTLEDFQIYNPNAISQPDYTGKNTPQYLIYKFVHDGSASSGFTLNISGSYTSLEYKLAKAWDGTPSGGTEWINGMASYNASQWNNGNPLGGSGGLTDSNHFTFGTNNIINCNNVMYVKIGFGIGERITALSVVFD